MLFAYTAVTVVVAAAAAVVEAQGVRRGEGSAGVFKRLCCPLCWCVTYAWPPTTTQWLLRVLHTRTKCIICICVYGTYVHNMDKTEFARTARESIVFS